MVALRSLYATASTEARAGLKEGGIPVGAALYRGGRRLATGHNRMIQNSDPTAHAEIECLRTSSRLKDYTDTVLYTTLASCPMCAGAILLFGIPRVVVGEQSNFHGELDYLRAHGVKVTVLDDPDDTSMLAEYIAANPQLWHEDNGIPPKRIGPILG